MSKIRTHYDNLKVARNAPDIVIKAAHKALLQMHHPDKAADKAAAERITRILNEARDVLLDPVRRKQHDDWIREKERHHHSRHHDHAAGPRPHQSQARSTEEAPKQDAGQAANEQPIDKYVVRGGIAKDTETGLTWCRFALGQTWRDNTAQDHAKNYTWQAAFDAARAFNQNGGHAGYTDWRLPSVNELKTLIAKQNGNKAAGIQFIDERVFPNNPFWIWSSTPYAGYGGGAWFVHFREGEAINEDANFARAVRLVRG